MVPIVLYWLAAAVILLFFELANPGHFFFLSFCFGTLAGAAISWWGFSVFLQSLVALIVTTITFFILVFWVKKSSQYLSKKEHQSNIFALIGQTGVILKAPIADDFGHVKIGGEVWACKVAHGKLVQVGDGVRVLTVKGAHVVVEKNNER